MAIAGILGMTEKLRLATGLSLKIDKCAVVMGKVDREEECGRRWHATAGLQTCSWWTRRSISVSRWGRGRLREWERVVAKATSRVADITSAPSLMSRALGFNVHFSSPFAFKC